MDRVQVRVTGRAIKVMDRGNEGASAVACVFCQSRVIVLRFAHAAAAAAATAAASSMLSHADADQHQEGPR